MAYVKLKHEHFVKPPSYIIFEDPPKVFKALNCLTQAVEFRGVDATEVIQQAIDALPAEGGKIFIKRGTYVCKTYKEVGVTEIRRGCIRTGDNVTLEGEGRATIIKLEKAMPCSVIVNKDPDAGNENIVIRDLYIDATGTTAETVDAIVVSGFGIDLVHCKRVTIENVWATGADYDGLKLEFMEDSYIANNKCFGNGHCGMSVDNWAVKNRVIGNLCYENSWHGIIIDSDALQNTVIGNTCRNNSLDGIHVRARCHGSAFIGNVCIDNRENGIMLDDTDGLVVLGNIVEWNGYRGIYAIGCNDGLIAGNEVKNNDQRQAAHSGIVIVDSLRFVVSNNRCYDNQPTKTQDYGIYEGGGSDYNLIHGNISRAADHEVGGISTVGVNTVSADNMASA